MSRARIAAVLVIVLALAIMALVGPFMWEKAMYRTVERVYWSDGSLRYDYTLRRWGGGRDGVLAYRNLSGVGQTMTSNGVVSLVIPPETNESGAWEVFVFPGNKGVPDLVSEEKPTETVTEELRIQRMQDWGR